MQKLHDKDRECKVYSERFSEAEDDLKTITEKLAQTSEQALSQEKSLKEKIAGLEAELKNSNEELAQIKAKGLSFDMTSSNLYQDSNAEDLAQKIQELENLAQERLEANKKIKS